MISNIFWVICDVIHQFWGISSVNVKTQGIFYNVVDRNWGNLDYPILYCMGHSVDQKEKYLVAHVFFISKTFRKIYFNLKNYYYNKL